MTIDDAAVHASPAVPRYGVRHVRHEAAYGVSRLASHRDYDAAKGVVFNAATDLPRETAADLIHDVLGAWRPGGVL